MEIIYLIDKIYVLLIQVNLVRQIMVVNEIFRHRFLINFKKYQVFTY